MEMSRMKKVFDGKTPKMSFKCRIVPFAENAVSNLLNKFDIRLFFSRISSDFDIYKETWFYVSLVFELSPLNA